jgi:hypothetical protein
MCKAEIVHSVVFWSTAAYKPAHWYQDFERIYLLHLPGTWPQQVPPQCRCLTCSLRQCFNIFPLPESCVFRLTLYDFQH